MRKPDEGPIVSVSVDFGNALQQRTIWAPPSTAAIGLSTLCEEVAQAAAKRIGELAYKGSCVCACHEQDVTETTTETTTTVDISIDGDISEAVADAVIKRLMQRMTENVL